MESYIPLVKAIIISTMFSWGTSSVVITDQYMLREVIDTGRVEGEEIKSYLVYDLKTNLVHVISEKIESQKVIPIADLFHSYFPWSMHPQRGYIEKEDTTVMKEEFGGFRCKREIRNTEHSSLQFNSYFAKIPWLDDVLNTEDKRTFAGFDREDYSPYLYLIYKYSQYRDQEAKDKVMTIIEKSEVDTTLIHTLMSLPVKKN